ncbi:MAG: hypothetical protein ACR2N8_02835 [Parvibaculales bacterium]
MSYTPYIIACFAMTGLVLFARFFIAFAAYRHYRRLVKGKKHEA